MTPKELHLNLEAFNDKFKLDNELANRRTARICMVLANLQRDPKRRSKPYKEEDFIPKEKKAMTLNQLELFLKAITMACGGDIEDG